MQKLKDAFFNAKIFTQVCLIGGLVIAVIVGGSSIGVRGMWRGMDDTLIALTGVEAERHFNNQVQAWHTMLIRAYSDNERDKHYNLMIVEGKLASQKLIELQEGIAARYPEKKKILRNLLSQHRIMSETFRKEGLLLFTANPVSYREIDKRVHGIDAEPEQKLAMLVDFLEAQIVAEFQLSKVILWIVLVLGVVFGLVIQLLYSNYLSNLLSRFVTHAKNVSAGDLTQHSTFRADNELGELSLYFNEMTRALSGLVKNIQSSSHVLINSTDSLSVTTKQQEATTAEQAASTQEIIASSKEISKTSKVLLNNMDEVAKAVENSASVAQKGNEDLRIMGNVLNRMVEGSLSISEKLSILNNKTNNISMVVTTINKVADQTNLLSVNAAIEADKSGEAGIGFSTVASEIRRLADQTAIATWDIEQLVKEIQTAVSASVMGMDKFNEDIERGVGDMKQVGIMFTDIVEQVRLLGPHFDAVHDGMQTQTMGADQIQEGIAQLGETVTDLLESIRFSNSSNMEITAEARTLHDACSHFKVPT